MITEIKVFIAEEQTEILQRLTKIIEATGEMRVVGTALDGGALLDHFTKGTYGIDIVLADIGLPVMDGLTAVARIKAIHKNNLKVIIITGLSGRDFVSESVKCGADGFVTKYRPASEIIEAIKKVCSGSEFVYKPDLFDPAHPKEAPSAPLRLIPIEQRILYMLTQGAISKQISEALNLSVPNVDRIRRLIMLKLKADNPTMLGAIAERFGLCKDLSDPILVKREVFPSVDG